MTGDGSGAAVEEGGTGRHGGGQGGGTWKKAAQATMEGGGSGCRWSSEVATPFPPPTQMISYTSLEVMRWIGDSSKKDMAEDGASSHGGRGGGVAMEQGALGSNGARGVGP
uniref:Uncharacterized protein n=1 Tax=Oryza glumipatula TaxID=40148 RepID=A0A0E0BJV5_9ORYZ